MTKVFADSCFWIALANKGDNLHQVAKQLREQHKNSIIVTTDECLVEFLSSLSKVHHRKIASDLLERIRNNKRVVIKEQSRSSFDRGLEEFRKLDDKSCSLVDCISFLVMRDEEIQEALAHDSDFRQAGFMALMQTQ